MNYAASKLTYIGCRGADVLYVHVCTGDISEKKSWPTREEKSELPLLFILVGQNKKKLCSKELPSSPVAAAEVPKSDLRTSVATGCAMPTLLEDVVCPPEDPSVTAILPVLRMTR